MTFHRWQYDCVCNALKKSRIVVVPGARQCGKTTLVKSFLSANTEYRTLDDRLLLQAATMDPQTFVTHHKSLMIIDEIQKAVMLLPALKMVVDENTRAGQYLLTGSANIQALPSTQESLAGRIRKVPLRPLSQGEILGHSPDFLKKAFSQTFASKIPISRENIIEIALRGGYPEPLSFSSDDRGLWHRNYVDTLLERDLKDIINIRRQDAMENLIQIVAAWSTKPIDISAIGSQLSLQRHTVESYFNAIETLFLIDRIPAYSKTDYNRAGKQSKLIFSDSGLMASLLRWHREDIRWNSDRLGKLIETHVGNELLKHVDTTEGKFLCYHYRDKNKREIDFIIENDHGHLLGIAVKASTTVSISDFQHLKWFKENLIQAKKEFIGIVFYTGNHVASLGDAMWAVPIGCLY